MRVRVLATGAHGLVVNDGNAACTCGDLSLVMSCGCGVGVGIRLFFERMAHCLLTRLTEEYTIICFGCCTEKRAAC
jgi:hypothetical protein